MRAAALLIGLALAQEPLAPAEGTLLARTVDAHSGAPLAGVLVEFWTEDGAEPLRLELCVARGVTQGPDGTVRLRTHDGEARAEKARLSRAGYASRVISAFDVEDGVELYPAEPLVGRVLDFAGKPVAGALVRSRETCMHAISAAQALTQADGSFVLPDCPADAQQAELEVIPRAHRPLAEIELDVLRRLQARDGSVDIFVIPAPVRRLRLVGADGGPLARRRVVTYDKPLIAAWTDAQGVVVMPPAVSGSYEGIHINDLQGEHALFGGPLPRAGMVVVQPWPWEKRAGPGSRVEVRFPGEVAVQPAPPRVVLFPSDGRVVEGALAEGLVPGRVMVLVGGDFTPWIERLLECEAGEQPMVLDATPEPAPRLRVLPPGGGQWWRVCIVAGELSEWFGTHEDSEACIHVPPGRPLTVFAESGTGELRRLELPALTTGEAVADLRPAERVLRAGVPEPDEQER